jgi:hypothetical protein
MQPIEVWARISSQCGLALLSVRHRLGLTHSSTNREDFQYYRFCSAGEPLLPWRCYRIDDGMAARVLAGGLPEADWQWQWQDDPDVWHRAPDTGRLWPKRFFGSIAFREGNPYGDVRRMWEPARLQQLVALGIIAAQSGNAVRDRAVKLLEAQFLSWVVANPPLTGVHYISAMECGLRLIAVCHAFDLVRPWLRTPDLVWPAVLQLVDGHATLIRQRLSAHSSLGNHTIAEAAGLVYAGILVPELPQAGECLATGLSLLGTEAAHQVLRDGGGAEQGLWYLRFISDLYGLVRALLAQRDREVPQEIDDAFMRSRGFLAAMTSPSGRLPSIGDGDNGYALSSMLPTLPRPHEESAVICLPSSGYSVLHDGTPSGTSLIFDHGPLGMGPGYAHGHADALSVILRTGDEEVLIDPGTFAYSGEPEWRTYFRGTSAHNTVTVDGLDQAVQETAFQWSSPYDARLVASKTLPDGSTVLIAVHDGYRKRTGVLHWRGIFHRRPGLWVVVDESTGTGNHMLELNWHFGCRTHQEEDGYLLSGERVRLHLRAEGGTSRILRGSQDPVAGWRSGFYGSKDPIDTLRVTYRGPLPHLFVTTVASETQDQGSRQCVVSLLKGMMDAAQAR